MNRQHDIARSSEAIAVKPRTRPTSDLGDRFANAAAARNDTWAMSPEAHGTLLIEMLDRYLANLDKVRISTLDAMCRSVSAGHGGICTFGDCLGEYLAIDPEGWIYTCQRFAGIPDYRLA